MAFDIRPKDGEAPLVEVSRILVKREIAEGFRRLCRVRQLPANDMLELLMREHVASSTDLEIVEDAGS